MKIRRLSVKRNEEVKVREKGKDMKIVIELPLLSMYIYG